MDHKREKRILYIINLSFAIMLFIAILFMQKVYFDHEAQKVALHNGVNKVEEREKVLQDFLNNAQTLLDELRNSPYFAAYIDDPNTSDSLSEFFLTYAKTNKSIMKIRYIDSKGMEKIRIDRHTSDAVPTIIEPTLLQDISQRYFYTDSLTAPLEEVWFSSIDLNEEYGTIAIPYEPTLRAIIPIDHNGFNGILMINYFMDDFLEALTSTPLYDMIITDNQGRTIYHYDNDPTLMDKSWSNSLENGYTLAQDFPDYAPDILYNHLLETDQFVSSITQLPLYNGLIFIVQLKHTYMIDEHSSEQKETLLLFLIVLVISTLFSYIIIKLFRRTFFNLDQVNQLNLKLSQAKDDMSELNQELECSLNELQLKVEQLNKTNNLFENERTKYKTILKSSTDSIIFMDLEGRVVECSDNAMAMLGYDTSDSKYLTAFDWDKQLTREQWAQLLIEVDEHPIKIERIHTRKDQSNYIAQISACMIVLDGKSYIYSATRDITDIRRIENELKEMSVTDDLTGLHNRKAYNTRITELLELYHRYGTTFSMMMFDIDHFKSVNDTYGHSMGDEVLKQLGTLVRGHIRVNDYAFRIGGEEFVILLSNTTLSDATTFANKLRELITTKITCTLELGRSITVSVGVIEVTVDDSADSMLTRADQCLYKAKDNGRNCVVAHCEKSRQ